MNLSAPNRLFGRSVLDRMERDYVRFINRARRTARAHLATGVAGPALPGDTVVTDWFGDIDRAQKTRLTDGLRLMVRATEDYRYGGRTCTRSVRWVHGSGTELHDRGLFGAAYAFGVTNVNRHFTLRIYSGYGLAATPYGWQLNTLIHELSHRILATADVNNTDGSPAYGTARCQQLVADPNDALSNASNWAFYINACNGVNDDEA